MSTEMLWGNKAGSNQFEHSEYSVDVPPFTWSKSFSGERDLCCHAELELVVCDLEKSEKFANEDPDILFVDECVRQLKCSSSYGYIAVA
jgi:hypothetical protein